MFTRLFLSILLGAATIATGALAAGDANRHYFNGRLLTATDMKSSRQATQNDVNRLKKLKPRPSVKCVQAEVVHQCLSSQPMTLRRISCRAGQTEATCCANARNYVNSRICGPLWDRLKKAGKTYYPGIFLCKCIETARTLKRLPKRPIRPR